MLLINFMYIYILQPRTPGKAASVFTGTQDKCAVCKKTVYPLEKVCNNPHFKLSGM